jgi:hypothetical protein
MKSSLVDMMHHAKFHKNEHEEDDDGIFITDKPNLSNENKEKIQTIIRNITNYQGMDDLLEVAVLNDGSVFGEAALINSKPRNATILCK